jgi:hypothetical protein
MKSISVQYQELKEGRITQHQFLRNARMLFPNFVTNHNSFDDSVKILKSKGLLNEGDAVKGTPDKAPSYDYPTQPGKYKKVVQKPEVDEQDGIYPATTLTDIPKEEVSKPIKSKNRPDGLEPAKDKDKKNEMKKIRIVKESKKRLTEAEQAKLKMSLGSVRKGGKWVLQYDIIDPNGEKRKIDFEIDKGKNIEKPGYGTAAYEAVLKGQDDKYNYNVNAQVVEKGADKPDIVVDEKSFKVASINENQVTAKQIQNKYNEMFGRNPQTTFADVAKALGVSESEIAIALFSPDLSKNLREDDDAAFNAMIEKAMEEEEAEKAIKSGFGIQDPLEEEVDVNNTPDEQALIKKLQQNPSLLQALKLIGMAAELDGSFNTLLNAMGLKNISKQQILAATRKALDANNSKDSNFTSKSTEKKSPSMNPIDAARRALPNTISSGASDLGKSSNRLRETIKKMVNKVMDEYEKGDESDKAPKVSQAINIVVNDVIDSIESNDIDLEFKSKDVEDILNNFQDKIGYRYSDEQFETIIDKAIEKLKEKRYNIK